METIGIPLPDPARSRPAIDAPGRGEGYWAGGPSAVADGDRIYLAYRLRRPVDSGRGYANVVAVSSDGETFQTVSVVEKDAFGAASLERPALVRRPDGGWRLYVSCSQQGSKHWWVEAIDADDPSGFRAEGSTTVFPGDGATAMKDPVVRCGADGRWEAWVCCHPLDEPGEEDRMTTRYATSADGLHWTFGPTVLTPRAGAWDSRGTRVTAVDEHWALYDGRASAGENWFERTGVAVRNGTSEFQPVDRPPIGTPTGTGALRYVSTVRQGEDAYRLYYEASRADGAHEIRTEVVTVR